MNGSGSALAGLQSKSLRPKNKSIGFATTLSSFMLDIMRASIAAVIVGTGIPKSRRHLGSPFAGAFLSRLVDDHVDQRISGLLVYDSENMRCDLDQKGLKRSAIPFPKYVGKFLRS